MSPRAVSAVLASGPLSKGLLSAPALPRVKVKFSGPHPSRALSLMEWALKHPCTLQWWVVLDLGRGEPTFQKVPKQPPAEGQRLPEDAGTGKQLCPISWDVLNLGVNCGHQAAPALGSLVWSRQTLLKAPGGSS